MRKVLALLYVCLLVSPYSPTQEQTVIKARAVNLKAARSAATAVEPVESDESRAGGNLPVRRVVLYKNGVGYFEHLGRVRGSQDVHIDFTSAQLNDVLKSLTVLDLAGGRITGVDYNSEAPLARRLATLRLALGEKPSEAEFLGALRGARIEVRAANGTALAGKLLSVERKTRNNANWTVETDEISLISDTGEVRSVDLNPATSVRIVDHDLNAEVGKYLGPGGVGARARRAADDGFDCRNWRAEFVRELHQRSPDLEDDLPDRASDKRREEAAAARLGDCGQHRRRRLEQCGVVAGGRRAALVHSAAIGAVLREAARRTAAGERGAGATDPLGDADGRKWNDRRERDRPFRRGADWSDRSFAGPEQHGRGADGVEQSGPIQLCGLADGK